MTERKQIFAIMKKHDGGKLEFTDTFWSRELATIYASKLITSGAPYITIHEMTLHGTMLDKGNQE